MYARLPNWLHRLFDLLGRPFVNLVVLPSTFLYHSARYALCSYPRTLGCAHISYWTYIKTNLARVHSGWTKGNWVNYADPNAGKILPSPYANLCDIEKLLVPAASAPRVGVAAIGIVPSVPVPGFMLRKKKLFGQTVSCVSRLKLTASTPACSSAPSAERGSFTTSSAAGSPAVTRSTRTSSGPWRRSPATASSVSSLPPADRADMAAVNYRKSLDKTSAFPASLLDALAGYQYLLSLGFEPKNIMLCGDSAGANACLALSRYLDALTDAGHHIGQVGALCLLCVSCEVSQGN